MKTNKILNQVARENDFSEALKNVCGEGSCRRARRRGSRVVREVGRLSLAAFPQPPHVGLAQAWTGEMCPSSVMRK